MNLWRMLKKERAARLGEKPEGFHPAFTRVSENSAGFSF